MLTKSMENGDDGNSVKTYIVIKVIIWLEYNSHTTLKRFYYHAFLIYFTNADFSNYHNFLII